MKTPILLCASLLAVGGCGQNTTPTDACKGRKAGDLVITEFLNDPSGTDTGNEWIEIFNTLGTSIDLKGITVYVKKSDGSGLKSHVIRAGTVASRGYFTVGDVRMGALPAHIGYSYADSLGALSNTDGIIGFKCNTTVIDEEKYSVTPKPGHARQLSGSVTPDAAANTEADWCDAPTLFMGTDYGTPGAANPTCAVAPNPDTCLDNGIARAIVPPQPGELIITEVMANPKALSDTVGEWVEVQAVAPVDLNGLGLSLNGGARNALSTNGCARLNPGEYGVLAGSTDAGLPNTIGTFTLSLTNSGFSLALLTTDAGIDSATVPTALDGISWQLDPTRSTAAANDDPLSFCRATVRFGDPDAGDFGTPGFANTACGMTPDAGPDAGPPPGDQCMDLSGQMRAVVRPNTGDLVISEVMPDPSKVADAVGEWFEVVVLKPVDLNGLVLANQTSSTTYNPATCVSADAGTHLVFAKSADPLVNGNLTTVQSTFGFDLTNSGGTLTLKGHDGGVLDTMMYVTTPAGASTQLDGTKYDALLNDNLANFCITDAGVTYGPLPDGGPGDRGTPGGQNKACP